MTEQVALAIKSLKEYCKTQSTCRGCILYSSENCHGILQEWEEMVAENFPELSKIKHPKTYKEGVTTGMNEAWAISERIVNLDSDQIQEVFKIPYTKQGIFKNHTVQEAKDLLAVWESKQPKVGDIVKVKSTESTAIITGIEYIYGQDNMYNLMFTHGWTSPNCTRESFELIGENANHELYELLEKIKALGEKQIQKENE